jgi:hypothetical protein
MLVLLEVATLDSQQVEEHSRAQVRTLNLPLPLLAGTTSSLRDFLLDPEALPLDQHLLSYEAA